MAVDEALLDSCAADPGATPTLRLYAWSPPALSLGRFQCASRAHDAGYLRENEVDLLRRPTGGTAVLHEHERTYAVVSRIRSAPFPGGVRDTFESISRALELALRRLGLAARAHAERGRRTAQAWRDRNAACFGSSSQHEISVDGLKLVGSAQLRRRGAFLQHGSILLRSDPARLARAIGLAQAPGGFGDLAGALGRDVGFPELDELLVAAFSESFRAELAPGELTLAETERATRLRTFKYLSRKWTIDGVRSCIPTECRLGQE